MWKNTSKLVNWALFSYRTAARISAARISVARISVVRISTAIATSYCYAYIKLIPAVKLIRYIS